MRTVLSFPWVHSSVLHFILLPKWLRICARRYVQMHFCRQYFVFEESHKWIDVAAMFVRSKGKFLSFSLWLEISVKRCGKPLADKGEGVVASARPFSFCHSIKYCHFEQLCLFKIATFSCEWFVCLLKRPVHRGDSGLWWNDIFSLKFTHQLQTFYLLSTGETARSLEDSGSNCGSNFIISQEE